MQTVIIRKYSTFFDPITSTQFNPILDKAAGVYIGVAQVDDSEAAHFAANSSYELISEDAYSALLTGQSMSDTVNHSSKLRADVAALSADVLGVAPPVSKGI